MLSRERSERGFGLDGGEIVVVTLGFPVWVQVSTWIELVAPDRFRCGGRIPGTMWVERMPSGGGYFLVISVGKLVPGLFFGRGI